MIWAEALSKVLLSALASSEQSPDPSPVETEAT